MGKLGQTRAHGFCARAGMSPSSSRAKRSAVEGSRRVVLNVSFRDPSTFARDDGKSLVS